MSWHLAEVTIEKTTTPCGPISGCALRISNRTGGRIRGSLFLPYRAAAEITPDGTQITPRKSRSVFLDLGPDEVKEPVSDRIIEGDERGYVLDESSMSASDEDSDDIPRPSFFPSPDFSEGPFDRIFAGTPVSLVDSFDIGADYISDELYRLVDRWRGDEESDLTEEAGRLQEYEHSARMRGEDLDPRAYEAIESPATRLPYIERADDLVKSAIISTTIESMVNQHLADLRLAVDHGRYDQNHKLRKAARKLVDKDPAKWFEADERFWDIDKPPEPKVPQEIRERVLVSDHVTRSARYAWVLEAIGVEWPFSDETTWFMHATADYRNKALHEGMRIRPSSHRKLWEETLKRSDAYRSWFIINTEGEAPYVSLASDYWERSWQQIHAMREVMNSCRPG